ncbi:MAG: hypothetical protein WC692_05655 [Erythrobacter sp.]|jgi:hypothetical protein
MARAALLLVAVLMLPAQAKATMAECAASQGASPVVSGVQVEEVSSDEPDLKMLRVTARRGAFMHVYFDPPSEATARQYSSCLGTQLDLLAAELRDEREAAQWYSVIFTSDQDYVPSKNSGVKARWIISTDPAAPRWYRPHAMVLETMPHEQVHDYQSRNRAKLPLWVLEGHATWAGLRITTLLDPQIGQSKREETLSRVDLTAMPAKLADWGDRRIKREAMLRQVSPEDRAKMEADPAYIPNVPFRFTLDDFESDESRTLERYAASLLIFEGLEERHGADRVRRWMAEITATTGNVSKDMLAASIMKHFGEELAELLKD